MKFSELNLGDEFEFKNDSDGVYVKAYSDGAIKDGDLFQIAGIEEVVRREQDGRT